MKDFVFEVKDSTYYSVATRAKTKSEAIDRGYGMEEVIEQLKEFSDNALKWEEGEE